MPCLSDNKIKSLLAAMEDAASGGDSTFAPWYNKHGLTPVKLEFPGGELHNPALAGWLMAWQATNRVTPSRLAPQDRFSAQGLEGKITVSTTLVPALLAWRELPEHRRQIIV